MSTVNTYTTAYYADKLATRRPIEALYTSAAFTISADDFVDGDVLLLMPRSGGYQSTTVLSITSVTAPSIRISGTLVSAGTTVNYYIPVIMPTFVLVVRDDEDESDYHFVLNSTSDLTAYNFKTITNSFTISGSALYSGQPVDVYRLVQSDVSWSSSPTA